MSSNGTGRWTILKTNPDGSKSLYFFPLIVFVIIANLVMAVTGWICTQIWRFFF